MATEVQVTDSYLESLRKELPPEVVEEIERIMEEKVMALQLLPQSAFAANPPVSKMDRTIPVKGVVKWLTYQMCS